jgi:hypothetical protein
MSEMLVLLATYMFNIHVLKYNLCKCPVTLSLLHIIYNIKALINFFFAENIIHGNRVPKVTYGTERVKFPINQGLGV